tara:strand:- start:7976 stop:9253 length:1278 start_codon:yes stop_codon:yes gene_type:complete
MKPPKQLDICIIGMGYVGLPLAVEFGRIRPTLGFDIDERRIEELKKGVDSTFEVTQKELSSSKKLKFTSDINQINSANCFIISVPTPIDEKKLPDFSALSKASEMVGKILKTGDIVIYESTVYPGATEEKCVPILEQNSELRFNRDFFCGYSPERINPGDKKHRLVDIKKITSGSTPQTAQVVDDLYSEIITAGTHKTRTIKVAEAAKVIENVQRDLNIALVNELSIIFQKLGIDTEEVLKAAETKWNFIPFRPGLVGGHCIGVDPYYLTFKSQDVGYKPQVILSGRQLNDRMGKHVAATLLKEMTSKGIDVKGANVLILGVTFKENCPDIRNTKVTDIIHELMQFDAKVEIYDPWASPAQVKLELNLSCISYPQKQYYDAIIISVAHREFKAMNADVIRSFGKETHILYDLKFVLGREQSDLRL